MDEYKISVLEKNGEEFLVPTEADANDLISSLRFAKRFEYVRSSDLTLSNNESLMIADTLDLSNFDLILEGNAILGVF